MDNPTFEDIRILHEDEEDEDDYYKTPDTSRVDETSFTVPDTSEATSTLRLRQEVKRDKINALYKHLNVTADPDLAKLDKFMTKKNPKTVNTDLLFLNGDKHWQSLINKCTSELLAPKTLREKFGGLNTMKSVLCLDETPPALERSLKAATKLKAGLPTDLDMESIPMKELSSLIENTDVKTREASQNADLDMRDFLGIHKALQGIKGEFLNNMSKLTEIDKRIEKGTKKLEEAENDPTYTDE